MKNFIPHVVICSSIAMLIGCTGGKLINNNNSSTIQKITLAQNLNKKLQTNLKESTWQDIGNARFSTGGTDNEKIVAAPNGDLYIAFADYTQHNKLSVMRYNDTSRKWNSFGISTLSAADASDISMVVASNGSLYVAFTDAGKNNKAVVLTYDQTSTSWKPVGGDAISAGKAAFTNIIVDANNTPYLAYSDLENSGKTKVVTYDKSSNTWKAVATFATTAKSDFNSMAFAPDGTLYLVCSMYNFNMGRALVKSYDKSSQQWNIVGDIALSNGIAQYTSIAVSPTGVPYITFADQGNDGKAKVMAYDKSVNHWQVIGNAGISIGSSQYNNIVIAPNGSIDIVFKDMGSNSKATALYFDKNSQQWKPLAGNSALISDGEANYTSLTLNKDGIPYIAYADNSADGGKKATVMGYVLIKEWHYMGQPGFSDGYTDYESLATAPNGDIYLAFTDGSHSGSKASVMLYSKNTNQWQYVGLPGFSDNSASNPHLIIVSDGTIYISFVDREHDNKISVMTYSKNINQWQYVGKQGFVSQVEEDSFTIAPDGTLYIAFRDLGNKDQASVMTYNKNNNQWQYVGQPGFSTDVRVFFTSLAIAPDGAIYIAFADMNDLRIKASVMTYNKSNGQWQYVGTKGFSTGQAWDGKLVVDLNGVLYLAFEDRAHGGRASVMTYSKQSNQWQYLGTPGFSGGQSQECSFVISPDGTSLYIAFVDAAHSRNSSVMTYNKNISQWQYVGRPGCSNSEAWSNTLSIAPNGVLHLAFHNGIARGKSTVMSFY